MISDFVKQAAARAKRQRPELAPEIFDVMSGLLILLFHGDSENEFVARFQQLTGPAMAKGVEDTAFYCFNRFASLNEVGGDPGKFGVSIEEFHDFCQQQTEVLAALDALPLPRTTPSAAKMSARG